MTTSGYGKKSSEFADGIPLELLSGSSLLFLLSQYPNIEAKIEVPEGKIDPTDDEVWRGYLRSIGRKMSEALNS